MTFLLKSPTIDIIPENEKEIQDKWERIGYLYSLENNKRNVSLAFEFTQQHLLSNDGLYFTEMENFCFPVIFRVVSKLNKDSSIEEISDLVINILVLFNKDFPEFLQTVDKTHCKTYNIDYEVNYIANFCDNYIKNNFN